MRQPETKLDVFELIAPLLQRSLTDPIPEQVATAIKKDSITHKASLPATIAWRIYEEGLKMEENFERTFQLPRGFLGGENPFTSFSWLYSMAPGHIRDVEAYLRSTTTVEEVTQAAVKKQIIIPQEPYTSTYIADLSIVFNTLTQLMQDDPTGFRLVDRIAYGPPIPNSPLTIIHQYPSALSIIQVGTERYKNLYRAVSEQTLP